MKNNLNRGLAGLLILPVVLSILAIALAQNQDDFVGDRPDGSRTETVHNIEMYDPEGYKINRNDDPMLPFSLKMTCNQCHDYQVIHSGWHFNFNQSDVPPGRPGQPWIYVDPTTGTQIGLSYRNWPGVYHPRQIGMTPFEFALNFGRQFPGNIGPSDDGEALDFDAPWIASGPLEINCLACHDAEAAHDQSQYAVQISRHNFRWAAAATIAFTDVEGSVKNLPDTWDYLLSDTPATAAGPVPQVFYDEYRFDREDRVFFDVSGEIPNQRCYFCHSNSDVMAPEKKWTVDQDVHLQAGMNCVDCHTNGLDHIVIRGYPGEEQYSDNPMAGMNTCQACHLGAEEATERIAEGRFAAPEPRHPGIPPVHFEKLTCTACHSAVRPQEEAVQTQTARAHGLGIHEIEKTAEMLPHLYYPAFMRNPDGKIGPYKVFWPSFWARYDEGAVEPLDVEVVREVIGELFIDLETAAQKSWSAITKEKLTEALSRIQATEAFTGQAAYISGGRLYTLDSERKLVEMEHEAADLCSWPIAHNVRPAHHSLGTVSCKDCHSTDAPFVFGEIPVDTPLAFRQGQTVRMIDYQDLRAGYMKFFAVIYTFRPLLKTVGILIAVILGLILLHYLLRAVGRLTETFK